MPSLMKKSASPIPPSTPPAQPALPLTTTNGAASPSPSPIGYSADARPALARRSGSTTSDSEKIAPIIRRLQEAKQVVYDAETSGLDWRVHHIVGHVLTFSPNPADSFYLPVRHAGGGNLLGHVGPQGAGDWDLEPHRIEPDLIKALDRPDLTIVGHHLDFDLKMLWQLDGRLQSFYIDTQIDAALLDEYKRSYKLENCANDAGVAAKKSQVIADHIRSKFPEAKAGKEMEHFWRLAGDDPVAVEYATGDGTTTWQLNDWQLPQITEQELDRVWDIECRLIPVLVRMSLIGVKVDPGRFTQLKIYIKGEIERLMAGFPENFNVKSPKDSQWWMEQHGVTDWPMTPPSLKFPEGQPSLNEEWLSKSDAGQKIVDVRKLITLRDAQLMPLQAEHIYNDRVHTDFNQMKNDDYGTITGRLSSSRPNLQAITKHVEYVARLHRTIFVPDDGRIWGSADFSQIEPRLLAIYSGCRVLLEGYLADPPVDAHTSVAIACNRDWYSMSVGDQKFYRNHYAKRINQTILTGGGMNVLISKYRLAQDEAKRVWNEYHRSMPEVKTIQKEMQQVMQRRGYIRTLLGRRCRLEGNRAYVALNRALQGGNADIIKLKMVEVDEYLASIGRPIDMLLSIHDSIDFQFPEEYRYVYENCLQIMEDFGPNSALPLNIPIVVDHGEGGDWAEATLGPAK